MSSEHGDRKSDNLALNLDEDPYYEDPDSSPTRHVYIDEIIQPEVFTRLHSFTLVYTRFHSFTLVFTSLDWIWIVLTL